MLSTDFEYSDYSKSLIIDGQDIDIEIFRENGTFAWHLEMQIDGKSVEWPNVFIADKAAYDAAVVHLRERGLNPDMFADDDDYPIVDSPLCQKLLVEGHPFEISIYRGVDEPDWILEITNPKGTSFIPEERFKTDQDALGAALADFENEPIEEFLG
ncbi:hypothetical protein [Halocynthiibacter sp.]|uniref:hypothetical protein n=1 Tax=Halocynthiibacter sp. TaxID=1979210 RepID=UPI003C54C849